MKFDLTKLDELQASVKKESKYSFLFNDVENSKKILDTLKRGVQISKIVNTLNEQITEESKKINSISLKQNLKTIIATNKDFKEYKNLFKARDRKAKEETKESN